jgi:hypothetical protein
LSSAAPKRVALRFEPLLRARSPYCPRRRYGCSMKPGVSTTSSESAAVRSRRAGYHRDSSSAAVPHPAVSRNTHSGPRRVVPSQAGRRSASFASSRSWWWPAPGARPAVPTRAHVYIEAVPPSGVTLYWKRPLASTCPVTV